MCQDKALNPTYLVPRMKFALGLLLIVSLSSFSFAAEITYNLVPQTFTGPASPLPGGFQTIPGPFTVTGTVTTDGNIGQLTLSDITTWTVYVNGTLAANYNPLENGLEMQNLWATSTSLYFPIDPPGSARGALGLYTVGGPPPDPQNQPMFSVQISPGGAFQPYVYCMERVVFPHGGSLYYDTIPSTKTILGPTYTYATVPEPSAVPLATMGAACWAVMLWRRAKRAR